jgi:hypothetical protein
MHGTLKARLKVSYLIIFRELRRRIASTHPKKKYTHATRGETKVSEDGRRPLSVQRCERDSQKRLGHLINSYRCGASG